MPWNHQWNIHNEDLMMVFRQLNVMYPAISLAAQGVTERMILHESIVEKKEVKMMSPSTYRVAL